MKKFIPKVAILSVIALSLSACDPQKMDTTNLAAASGSTQSSSGGYGVFELVSDDFTDGSINSAGITMTFGQADGDGSYANPITFGLARIYSIGWSTSATTESAVKIDLFDVNNPDMTETIANLDCDSDGCNQQSVECYFNLVGTAQSMFCKKEDSVVGGSGLNDILSKFNLEVANLPYTLGLSISLCNATQTACDKATIAYLSLSEGEQVPIRDSGFRDLTEKPSLNDNR
ncbi:MAG: hypothetical protein KDJ38_05955 [Gammaproteobacteria bacterium]|nr:hypothetical protein [Gammaproteobacteria bacterium]